MRFWFEGHAVTCLEQPPFDLSANVRFEPIETFGAQQNLSWKGWEPEFGAGATCWSS